MWHFFTELNIQICQIQIGNTFFDFILSAAKRSEFLHLEVRKKINLQDAKPNLKPPCFISKLTSRDYKITVLQLQQFRGVVGEE